MKKYNLILIGILYFGFCLSQTNLLEVNTTAGDYYTGNEITLSWSIGEGIIETFYNNEITLTQGFQQPCIKVSLVEESEISHDIQISVSPNPTKDIINIQFIGKKNTHLLMELYDLSGKLLIRKTQKGLTIAENIDLSGFSSNMFILRIIDKTGILVRTYKIQKIR